MSCLTGSGAVGLRPRRGWALIGFACACLGLAGCGDRILETGLSVGYVRGWFEEPEPSVSRVRRITGAETSYPTLGEVPARPLPPPSAGEVARRIGELSADNAAGLESVRGWAQIMPAVPAAPAPKAAPPTGAPAAVPAR